ncbi:MAG TPA: SMP-30/gluconolactonase/LRE family protein [Flavisolibacter sp.]|jgi:gluconolactonase|nr:SMP-30/gluconolactonase/LRE family protein [Flavisolibacter sp.]
MNQSLILQHHSITDYINSDFQIETLSSDCIFTEGPVWNKEGYYLFSDIPANVIYKIQPGSKKEFYLENSGTNNPGDADLKPDQIGSNALAYDHDGNLLICQHGSHGIAIYDGKELKPFITNYNGRPFNSPNDFIIHSDGRIYFSDPPYGLKEGQLNPAKFQPLAAVYCWKNGDLQMICDKYKYPNGVCFSPDERTLYICSNKPFEKFVSEYDPSTNQFRKVLIDETSDGIECDRAGNVYLCNKEGIIICSAAGERLARIQLPTVPANICWGGKNKNDLFVTARQNVFLIQNLQK